MIGVIIFCVMLGLFVGWIFLRQKSKYVTTDQVDSVPATNTSVTGSSVTQSFTLFPGQVIQSDDLDLRIVVNTLFYIPCNSNENTNCRFRQFRADLTVSLISNPTHSEHVSFLAFPSQAQALGKVFEIVDATSEKMNVLVSSL